MCTRRRDDQRPAEARPATNEEGIYERGQKIGAAHALVVTTMKMDNDV